MTPFLIQAVAGARRSFLRWSVFPFSSADVRTKRQLDKWVQLGVAYARSLPPKR